jgi:hypothetical protein
MPYHTPIVPGIIDRGHQNIAKFRADAAVPPPAVLRRIAVIAAIGQLCHISSETINSPVNIPPKVTGCFLMRNKIAPIVKCGFSVNAHAALISCAANPNKIRWSILLYKRFPKKNGDVNNATIDVNDSRWRNPHQMITRNIRARFIAPPNATGNFK